MFQAFDAENPSPSALAGLLRDPSRWPADFGPWNYAQSSCCAMGLAVAKGWAKAPHAREVSRALKIDYAEGERIFLHGGKVGMETRDWTKVSPEDIAQQLEALV